MRSFMVGVVGPTCSGKSTISAGIAKEIGALHLKMDDFYKDASSFPKITVDGREYSFSEHQGDIRFRELYRALFRLRGGHSAEVPIYSRSEGRAVGTRTVGPADTVICEGFLLFYHSHIRHLFDLRIAIQLGKAQQFERRLARQPEVDQHYLKNVIIPTCKRFMRAQSRRSHHVLDGTMELPALREEVAGLVNAAREARLRSVSRV